MSLTPLDIRAKPVNSVKSEVHLGYLDSLRGLAAFYVMLSHIRAEVVIRSSISKLPPGFLFWTQWMDYGLVAVMIFIVLSGYCLMIPVALSSDGRLRGGALMYLRRRARRILPPYYAALGVSLIVIALESKLRQGIESHWVSVSTGAFRPGVLLSHIFLLHNLRQDWAYQINGPLWSVATEWQIYFLFPAVLLPLWRRFGLGVAVAAGVILGTLPHYIFSQRLDVACPQFIGLFAIGMAGAVLSFQAEIDEKKMRRWGFAAAGILLASFAAISANHRLFTAHTVQVDPVIGAGVACFLVFCTQWLRSRPDQSLPSLLRVLQSPLLISLGAMSYSLYLIHYVVLGSLHVALLHTSLTPLMCFAILAFVGLPLALGCAYLFHVTVERRFMTSKR